MIWTLKRNPKAIPTVFQVVSAGLFASTFGALYFGGILMFVFSFAIGVGPIPGLLLSEFFPSRIRAKAIAFCMWVHWVFNFMVGLLLLRLLELMGPQMLYYVFGSFCMMVVVFVNKHIMETKGKSLPEIEIALLPQE